jgi:hypothetical protein
MAGKGDGSGTATPRAGTVTSSSGGKHQGKKLQGGSDISGTFSELHQCIKNSFFILIILLKSVLAVCLSVNKNRQTHLGNDESTGRDSSHDSL